MRVKRLMCAGVVAAMTLSVAACGGDGGAAGKDDDTLLVWTTEDQAERVAQQKKILEGWGSENDTKIKLVAIAEDQLGTTLASSVAAGEKPDVIAALSVNGVNQLASDDLLDTAAAEDIVDSLGADTFSERTLEFTRDGDTQLSVPSDAWSQLIFYRKDRLDAAGLPAPKTYDDLAAAAKALDEGKMAGIVASTAPADSFTQQTFEQIAVANGCQLTDDAGDVTLDSDQCANAVEFYTDLIKDHSVKGNQDADTTRASYFAGAAGMVIWSSFMLDELAGLRSDALPTCPECKGDPEFLVKNTGVVTDLQGPDGSAPATFGEVVSWTVLTDANPKSSDMVEYMMSDGYVDWLSIAPEGKIPTRRGTADDAEKYVTAWKGLEAGVDKKALLSEVYSEETLAALATGVDNFDRWGVRQGQGRLAGAVAGQFVLPQSLATVLNSGASAEDAAESSQQKAEQIQDQLGG